MPDPTVPTSESLTLSATLFHADVDSWLPANFGVSQPESSKAAEWESALRSSADRAQRLGLGHAALEDAALGAKFKNQRAGLSVLEQKLKKRKNAEESTAAGAGRDEEDSEEEAESRTRSIKTNKKSKDPFAGKGKVHPALAKKETKVHPALLKKSGAEEKVHPAILAKMAAASADSTDTRAEEKSEEKDEPSPSTSLGKRPRDDSDDETEEKKDDEPVLSKAERKREKKRRQKLRKAAEAEAAKAS